MKRIFKQVIISTLGKLSKFQFVEKLLINIPPQNPNKIFWVNLFSNPKNYSEDDIRLIERNGIYYHAHLNNFNDFFLFYKVDFLHELIYRNVKNGMVVFDIGTNQGEILMNMAKINPDGVNYGFEPIPFTYEKARRNVEENKFVNIVLNNYAVSDKEEKLKILSFPQNHSGGVQLTKDRISEYEVEIESVSIDSFVVKNNIQKVDFMKIDVEGFEKYVLNGSLNVLKKYKPILFVEIFDKFLKDNNSSAIEIISLIKSLGYEIRIPNSPHLLGDDFVIPNHHFDVLCTFVK